MENLKGFMDSAMARGSVHLDDVQYLFKYWYNNSFRLLWMYFDHGQFEIKTFPFYALPWMYFQSWTDEIIGLYLISHFHLSNLNNTIT